VGPILAVILGFAAAQDSVLTGIVLLAVYSMGLAIRFLLTAFGIERFLKLYSRFRAHMHASSAASRNDGLPALRSAGRYPAPK
jgi:cytochrome c-type biogenesis protein